MWYINACFCFWLPNYLIACAPFFLRFSSWPITRILNFDFYVLNQTIWSFTIRTGYCWWCTVSIYSELIKFNEFSLPRSLEMFSPVTRLYPLLWPQAPLRQCHTILVCLLIFEVLNYLSGAWVIVASSPTLPTVSKDSKFYAIVRTTYIIGKETHKQHHRKRLPLPPLHHHNVQYLQTNPFLLVFSRSLKTSANKPVSHNRLMSIQFSLWRPAEIKRGWVPKSWNQIPSCQFPSKLILIRSKTTSRIANFFTSVVLFIFKSDFIRFYLDCSQDSTLNPSGASFQSTWEASLWARLHPNLFVSPNCLFYSKAQLSLSINSHEHPH